MPTIKKWVESFPEPWRGKALKYEKLGWSFCYCDSAPRALFGAFNWAETDEGGQYWRALALKLDKPEIIDD